MFEPERQLSSPSDAIDSEADPFSDAESTATDSTGGLSAFADSRPVSPTGLVPLQTPSAPPTSPPVFQWYAVRAPSLRTAPVCRSALGKRHVHVSTSCLHFKRVYELQAAKDAIPQPLEAFPR